MSGRLKNMRHQKEQRGKLLAEDMMKAGLDRLIVWRTETQCLVPSQTSDMSYEVDLLKATCSCPASTQGGIFKQHNN